MEEMLNQLISQILAWADTHGAWAGMALACGMLIGPKAVPALKRVACRTPTKIDDLAVNMLEALLNRKTTAIEQLTASELEKIITTPVLCEVVRIRRAKIAAEKEAAAAKA
jgi:hypothetical protein